MLKFRVICAVMVAWAINLVLARPEADVLLAEVSEMSYIGPIAGALVGFFILAKRQGSGLIVAALNGMWTGVLAIVLAGFMFLSMRMLDVVTNFALKNFEAFLRILGQESQPFIDISTDYRLIGITIGAVTVTGILSEVLHWVFVRLRRARGEEDPREQVKSAVAKAGGPMS